MTLIALNVKGNTAIRIMGGSVVNRPVILMIVRFKFIDPGLLVVDAR